MTHEAIPLHPAVRRTVDLLSDTVARGLRALIQRFGPPAHAWRSNHAGAPDLGYALVKLRRLHKILRYVFVILATRLVEPAPPPPPRTRTQTAPRRAERADDPATWRMTFALPAPCRVITAGAHAQPAHLRGAPTDRLRTLARQMEGLRRAIAHPMRHVRRIARVLRRDLVFISRRQPRRPPPTHRRAYLEELLMARDQASWDLRQLNSS